jgi:simple sugar transport system substrate-binding protein
MDVWGPYYIERVQAVLDGTWKTSDVWYGLKEGMVVIAPYNPKLPPEAVEAAEAVRKAIADGSLHPFAGPIRNQAGEEKVPEGSTLSDKELLGMDWYVEGVSA